MAVEITSIFDKTSAGSLTAAGTDLWVDLTSYGPDINTPIPAGKRIYIGYVTCISQDKKATFELRPNLPTKSAGNTTDTSLRGFTAVDTGKSEDIDLYYGGAIKATSPLAADSTGVEKLWLRIRSGSSSTGTFEFIFNYAII